MQPRETTDSRGRDGRTRSLRSGPAAALALLALAASTPRSASGQAGAVQPGATTGYELTLSGRLEAELGGELRVFGVAWTVDGLDALRPGAELEVEARLTVLRDLSRDRRARETVRTVTTRADRAGRFELAVPVGAEPLFSPEVTFVVRRRGQPGREFTFRLGILPPEAVDLLTDRLRYQPGERVRLWSRLTRVSTGAPVQQRRVQLALVDRSGRTVAERAVDTSGAGVAAAELELPASAESGSWEVTARVSGEVEARRSIEVSRRTVERLQARLELDQEILPPGGELTGRVVVETPSGGPVQGARVEIRVGAEADPIVRETDPEGRAAFETRARSFLSGEVATEQVRARVVHPAHGTVVAASTFLLARVRWVVEATPAGGGIVPEVDAAVHLSVADPRGRPVPAETRLVVTGLGVRGGRAEVLADRRGLAEVPMRLPRGAAARMRAGGCAGVVATTVEVEVQDRQPVVARLCVPVAVDATVSIRADGPLAAPGAEVSFAVARRGEAGGRPVLVEAIWSGRAVAWTVLEGRLERGRVQLPAGIQGPIWLRARPVLDERATSPLDAEGATAFGVGSHDAVLVRPADAFGLEVAPERELYRVREKAAVRLSASRAPERGWVALLVRDEAAHGGEEPFELAWHRGALAEAVAAAAEEDGERYLRASLASLLRPDAPRGGVAPIVRRPWEDGGYGSYSSGPAFRGVVRDPVSLRESLRRVRLARAMVALRDALRGAGTDPEARRGLVAGAGARAEFAPEAIQTLVQRGALSPDDALTLGGEPLQPAMLREIDPSFTFARVARQLARERLVRLLHGLALLADPDEPRAARAIAGEPPERWLSTMVRLGMLDAADIVDPWGNAFAFRPVASGRAPVVVVSERAARHELVSPGPDGRAGTADDVRDPFERIVPRETLYAVASGEDQLMERLGRLAPGSNVLEAMARAYGRLGLSALEERERGPVGASGSEDDATLDFDQGAVPREMEAMLESARDRAEAPPASTAAGPPAMARQEAAAREPSPPPGAPAPSRLAAMGELVRERFPATLHFVAELPLDRDGQVATAVPLADALTTYRLEAIAWTASGWTTSAASRLRVDQEAMVEAPVPETATVGDLVRLPVRVSNRTGEPLAVDLEVTAEGDLAVGLRAPARVTVPARDAVEVPVEVRLQAAGAGHLVVRAVRAGGGPLDAVRRPLEVIEDVRLARESFEALVQAGERIRLEVPAEASPRGPGEVRLAAGSALFGDPASWGSARPGGQGLWAAWALALAGRPLPPSLLASVEGWLDQHEHEMRGSPSTAALLLSVAWADPRVSEEIARALLRLASAGLPPEDDPADDGALGDEPAWTLLALAPVVRDLSRRETLRPEAEGLARRLRRLVASAGASAAEAPETWALAAAALGLTGPSSGDERAREMVRRAGRHVVGVGEIAWLEPAGTDGTIAARLEPTSLLALARILLGDRASALPLLRSLGGAHGRSEGWPGSSDGWPGRGRALATAAATLLSPVPVAPRIRLDGAEVPVRAEAGLHRAELDGLGRPGLHELEVVLPEGTLALAWVEVVYGLPWRALPRRQAQVEIEWTGPVGPRDGRAGLLLAIRNRGARILPRPVVEVELPAGAELDEPTRRLLADRLAAPAVLEGRTLRLRLRPLAPGGFLRLPLPVRWSVGGRLVGLGTTFWDDSRPEPLERRPIRVVPSHGVEIADGGSEPPEPEGESSPPLPDPRPPSPGPILPLGLLSEATR